MDFGFFKELLSIDSTSGKEREVALWLHRRLEAPQKELMEVGDGTLNLLLSWGTPRVVFCTHMDTVPPYIAPVFPEDIITDGTPFASLSPAPPTFFEGGSAPLLSPCGSRPSMSSDNVQGHGLRRRSAERCGSSAEPIVVKGRGACDAKGQILALYTACKALEAEECTDFGLLLLAGEETGSWGAKAFSKTGFEAPFLIIGEPTENKVVSASKGTLSYDLTFTGEAFHSGYPQYGVSAVELFNQFYNALKAQDFGVDPELGETTWNVGLLHSDNPQNILSPELTCRVYFRTTFVSHQAVQDWMEQWSEAMPAAAGRPYPGFCDSKNIEGEKAAGDSRGQRPLKATARGGDRPARYVTLPGFPSAPAAFGSDAPHLTGFGHKIICGPGSIRHAHRPDEQITVEELSTAVSQYIRMYHQLVEAAV